MLKIRNVQISQIELACVEMSEESIHRHLLSCYPGEFNDADPVRVKQFIRWGVHCATEWGFLKISHIMLFIDIALIFGAMFDAEPWANAILCDEADTEDGRMERLLCASRELLRSISDGNPV